MVDTLQGSEYRLAVVADTIRSCVACPAIERCCRVSKPEETRPELRYTHSLYKVVAEATTLARGGYGY